MPSSYTTLLGLVQPATGELNGTWGTTVNTQLTQLIEDAIAGAVSISVTAGDATLSTTGGGASNQARMAALIFTGTPGVARTVYAPKQNKAYAVFNRSNAVVTVKGGPTSPTTGTALAAGASALIAWDSSVSDFVFCGAPTVAGVVPLESGGTGATTAAGARTALDVQQYDAATAKTNVAQAFTAQQTPQRATATATAGAAYTWTVGTAQVLELTFGAGNITTLSATGAVAGTSYLLYLKQDSVGGRTVAWSGFKFASGTAPVLSTAANAVDVFTFYYDGTSMNCTGQALGEA